MRFGVFISAVAAMSLAAAASTSAHAETWDYANAGTQNAASYTFSAAADGLLKAYFMPSTGSYHSALGVKVNGVTIGQGALPMGTTYNFVPFTFGSVRAGDAIEFFIDVTSEGTPTGTYFSNIAHNADGLQHVWAAPHFDQWYLGPEGVPEGTFIGFEDTTTGDNRGDLNYRDYTFVVPNLTVLLGTPGESTGRPPIDDGAVAAVPEPASWGTMLLGFGVIGGALRRRRAGRSIFARA